MESPQFTISTIVIIVSLIVPGVIFKRFYYQGQFTKQFGAGQFADRLITNLFWGIIVQLITFLIFIKSFGFEYENIKRKIDTAYTSIFENHIPSITYQQVIDVLEYFAFLIFVAVILGSITHLFIRYFKLDIRFNVLRFSNKWNYLIRGDILSTREFKGLKKGKIDSTVVDIIIDDSTENNKLITGFLTDYTISEKTGELESIHLTAAKRYSQTDKKYKDIPGDCLIIPCHRMVNMNLQYVSKAVGGNQTNLQIPIEIFRIFVLIGFILCFTFPWYFEVPTVNKILGLIFSVFSWLLIMALLHSVFFQPNLNSKLKRNSIQTMLAVAIIFVVLALLVLHLLPSFQQIKNFF